MATFAQALAALLGKDARGLPASTIARAKDVRIDEHKRWSVRGLSTKGYADVWADGVHLQARPQDEAQCIMVIIGAAPEGKKEWLGLSTPRESVKYEKAADCLKKDREPLFAFYDFPAEHWKHRRTSNPIESTFATVRHRTIRSKGCLSNKTALCHAAAGKLPPFEEGPVNPRDLSANQWVRRDDASFTVKNDKTYFGYKAHLAVDEGSDLIRQAEMTSADLHDSQRGDAMIQGDEGAYYADKAYERFA